MKRFRIAGLFLLGLLFSACTTPPISIPLSDVSIDLDVVFDTNGAVVFPADPVELEEPPPGTALASVVIAGVAELYPASDVTFEVYASDTDPSELGCAGSESLAGISGYYICENVCEDNEHCEKIGELKFASDKPTDSFTFQGEVLTRGINEQSLYLGLAIGGGSLQDGATLKFTKMRAVIRLALGQ